MESPVHISFKNIEASDALRQLIEERVGNLERVYGQITRCDVVVEQPDRHHTKGGHFDVRIHLGVPNEEFVVDREPGRHERHTDAYAAVRDAFKAAEKQLKSWRSRERHQDRKHHNGQPEGTVVRMFPDQDHGFIQTTDGTEVYFHRNALLNSAFDDLQPGTRVRYVEQQGVDGPQASTVRLA